AGVDDELDRFRAELSDSLDNLVGQFACTRIYDECALRSHLNRDIAAVSRKHVNIAGNVQRMNLTVVGSGIFGAADLWWSGWERFALCCRISCCGVFNLCKEFRIHGFSAAQCPELRDLVLLGVLIEVRILSKEMAWDEVILTSQNLLAVITCV